MSMCSISSWLRSKHSQQSSHLCRRSPLWMETTLVSSAFLEEIASASVSAPRASSTTILVAVTNSSSAFLEEIASASLSALRVPLSAILAAVSDSSSVFFLLLPFFETWPGSNSHLQGHFPLGRFFIGFIQLLFILFQQWHEHLLLLDLFQRPQLFLNLDLYLRHWHLLHQSFQQQLLPWPP